MLQPTSEQQEQIENLFTIITEGFDDILFYPVVDEKTGVERLSFCVADRKEKSIYRLGIIFLPDDPLYKRFSFKEDTPDIITEKPPGFLRNSAVRIWKFIRLLWL